MKEFNLSDKIYDCEMGEAIYLDSVREFIKILKEIIQNNTITSSLLKIDELAGERLK